MAYKVTELFDDLEDYKTTKNGRIYHRYEVGDTYPRRGATPSEGRIAELAGNGNVRGYPLIAEEDTGKKG